MSFLREVRNKFGTSLGQVTFEVDKFDKFGLLKLTSLTSLGFRVWLVRATSGIRAKFGLRSRCEGDTTELDHRVDVDVDVDVSVHVDVDVDVNVDVHVDVDVGVGVGLDVDGRGRPGGREVSWRCQRKTRTPHLGCGEVRL